MRLESEGGFDGKGLGLRLGLRREEKRREE
jgi:hypothetical protein